MVKLTRESEMTDNRLIRQKIEALKENDRIACHEALKIAQELNTSPDEVGKILNEMKVKIVHCQLGCFP
jgi:hypothetical protein